MTGLTPALDAALSGRQALVFGAVEMLLPGYPLRLLDGAGTLAFGGNTFVGKDATFGVLSAITDLTDGAGDSVPAFNITLFPASDAAAATLSSPTAQGSLVTASIGAVDPATGLVIPDPYAFFIGEVDFSTLKSTATGRTLEFEVVSLSQRLFADDEGIRLSPAAHRAVWPGEAGLDAVTNIDATVYWGQAVPNNIVNLYNSGANTAYGTLSNGQRLAYV